MKRFIVAVLCIAVAIGLASAPAAANDKELHGQVSFDFWFSDLDASGSSADQTYVPFMSLDIEFAPGWSAAIEYANGLSDDVTPPDDVIDEMESNKFLIGVEHRGKTGFLTSVAWHKYQFDETFSVGSLGIDADGLRLGIGYAFEFKNSNWGGTIEYGYGISNDSDVSVGGASVSGDADVKDYAVTFDYTWDSGLKANIGYRYEDLNADVMGISIDAELKGPFVGFGYVW